jgi:hypothetical protein
VKVPFQQVGDRRRAHFVAMFLWAIAALSLLGGCSKGPPSVDEKAVMGDEISLGMYQRFGWELVTSHREDENTTAYLFKRPENFPQSVQDIVAEETAETKDKTRLADKELSEAENTDGTK